MWAFAQVWVFFWGQFSQKGEVFYLGGEVFQVWAFVLVGAIILGGNFQCGIVLSQGFFPMGNFLSEGFYPGRLFPVWAFVLLGVFLLGTIFSVRSFILGFESGGTFLGEGFYPG